MAGPASRPCHPGPDSGGAARGNRRRRRGLPPAQSGKGREGFIRECLAAAPPETVDKLRREVLERADQAIPALDDDTTPDWLRTARRGEAAQAAGLGRIRPTPADPRGGEEAESGASEDGPRGTGSEHARLAPSAGRRTQGARQSPIAGCLRPVPVRPLAGRWWSAEGEVGHGATWACSAPTPGLKLSPLVRAWPGETSISARPRPGVPAGDRDRCRVDAAQRDRPKLSFKALKAKAAEMMEAIARDRGLSRPELEDRIVPDCDLDERGGRVFDFGPRRFGFALGQR